MIRVKQSGFTLVELVTVILILGVLAVGVSGFVIFGTRIFVESTTVDQVLSQSRFAIERMTRELRSAVPNSVRQTSGGGFQCLEFVPIKASASYVDVPVFPDTARVSATVFNLSPAISDVSGYQMLVYPLQPSEVYQASNGSLAKIFDVTRLTGNTIEFHGSVRFSEGSASKRFYLVNEAVSYCFSIDGGLYRYAGYNWANATQPLPAFMGDGVLMAEGVINDLSLDPPISLTPATLVNNAMIHIQPEFEVVGQSFRYQHQVQVVNVP
ncbi:PilW family protein [Paraferrimonas sedimenticola]|uniref:MSHA biogenesis protein MshO n=1 Tax=Paraferrimonas sedimenticola TaxID=375674 RepID=A0AA37W1F4_9GAMM|nr:type II secretion system protein [Paraferrimonas sedimenticola]GLP97375.1 MSHA biogenesis protein MshO [Paraferrimonas sedimenticola]